MTMFLVTCACGLEMRGEDDDIVAKVQQHGRQAHNMDVTPEEVFAMATAVSEG